MTAKENTNAKHDNVDDESATVSEGNDRKNVPITDFVDQYSGQTTRIEDDSVDNKILAETELTTTTVSALLDDSLPC